MSKREFLAASAVTTAYAIGGRAIDRAIARPETRRIALALVDDESEAGRSFARA
ncbi:MAG: hypothetical protein H7X93_10825, partial [Sphingomonadaceae bacterium]|nr:hypothetical protein [Sphingomonadaceae bacterium]